MKARRPWPYWVFNVMSGAMALVGAATCVLVALAIIRGGLETQAPAPEPVPEAPTYPVPTTLRECLDWYAALDRECIEIALPDGLDLEGLR